MKKRGLSAVVTTLIIILLVLVATGIVWVVIRDVLSEGAEEISLGKLTINLEIKRVQVNGSDISITLKRRPGKGKLAGVVFIISDGNKTESFERNTSMEELAEQKFNLNYSGWIEDISIAPIVKSKSGKDIRGNIIDTYKVGEGVCTPDCAGKVCGDDGCGGFCGGVDCISYVKNMNGLVSWWRLDGNANDEMGLNNGTNYGATSVNGKFGEAYEFDGVDDYISIPHSDTLDASDFTINLWVKRVGAGTGSGQFFLLKNAMYGFDWASGTTLKYYDNAYHDAVNVLDVGQWHMLAMVHNSSTVTLYFDGVFDSEDAAGTPNLGNDGVLEFGRLNPSYFNGTLDEIAIFNRSLNITEIQTLYGLNLSA